MIASISGVLLDQGRESVVIEAQGVGFEILVSSRTQAKLPEMGGKVRLFTHMVVREDDITLYGFDNKDDKAMFLKLIAVSGVGPKVALSILSGMTTSQLAIALVSGDTKAITKIPGIGKKTAERLILELKEKVDQGALSQAAPQMEAAVPVGGTGMAQEAIGALMALGYSSAEASRAVGKAGTANSVEELIVAALRGLDSGR